ncbi:MAG: hypothetical protein MPJ50_10210 [Pirellulales bacterium]|nr:hypothetical protein [Pirellulales bacterium]
MGVLTKAWEQAKDLFLSMTPGARLTAVLLFAVIVVSLGYLFMNSGANSADFLLGGRPFDPVEMGRIQAAFGQAGLSGAVIEGSRIKVPSGEEAKYLAAMASAGVLPRDAADIMAEAMTDLSPFASREERKYAIATAKQRMLAQWIRVMDDGIENAVVVYSEDESRGLTRKTQKTASVALRSKDGIASIEPSFAQAIRQMIKHAYVGLDLNDISITVNDKPVIGPSDSFDPAMGAQERYFAAQLQQQKAIDEKVRKSLARWVPEVTVSSIVELDPKIFERERSRELDDKKGGTLSDLQTEDSTTSEATPASGRPPEQNGANSQASLTGTTAGTSDETSSTTSEKTTLPGHTDRETETAGLRPVSVSVSVGVPSSYFIDQWKADNPEAGEPEVTDWHPLRDAAFLQWRSHVLGQISTPTSAVNAEVTFTDFPSLPSSPPPEEEFMDSAMNWVGQHGGNVGMFFLGLVGLLMVRSFVKSATKREPVSAEQDEPEVGSDEDPIANDAPRPARKWDASDSNVKEELAGLVREDPDTAASILQGWISSPT